MEHYVLTDKGDLSNYLGVNIRKNPEGTFQLFQLQLME